MRKSLALCFLTLLLAAPLLADSQELRPVTHEDLWAVQRLGGLTASPDGQYAVVSVTRPAYDKDEQSADLWLIHSDGSTAPRQLTATAGGESGVDWSPDGSRIAFSARRGKDKATQIYVLNMNGPGEAERITDFATGASNPRWSPDGRQIAFESEVWVDARGDEGNRARLKKEDKSEIKVSRYEGYPVRNWDHWITERQTRLFVQEARAGAEAVDLMYGSELIQQSGYVGSLAAVWAPDGRGLVVTATQHADRAAFSTVTRHLWYVPAAGGEPRALTSGTDYSCTGARFSHDGKTLFCRHEAVTEWVYNHTNLARADWKDNRLAQAPEVLTAGFDRSVAAFDVSKDDRTLYLTALDHGRVRLFSLPASGGEVQALNSESGGVYGTVQATPHGLLSLWESSTEPVEVVRVDPASGRHEALSQFNAGAFESVDRPAYREFWFTSSQGRRIHNWIILPPDFDESKKYPLVLNIHGGPFSSSLEADHVRWSPHLLAAPGYVVLQTDYTGSVGYGAQFSRNIEGDPLKTPGQELIEAADEALARFDFLDGERMAATGASYGGHLVNWLLGTSDRFKALVGHAGLISLEGQWSTSDVMYHRERMNGGPPWGDSPIWSEQSPHTYAAQFATPTLLTIGERDYRVPLNETLAAWAYLQRQQVPSRLLVFHDANHWIMKGPEARHFWNEVHDWLARYLLDEG